jgi:hypothetical protein
MHQARTIRTPQFAPSTGVHGGYQIIRTHQGVAPRMRGQKRKNVFYDDRGFPDQSHDFDVVLRNIDGGTVFRKRKHPAPALGDIAPKFFATYDKSIHGAKRRKELDLSHLLAPVRDKVYRLIQKYWSVFDNKGQFVPVKDYTCDINTGLAKSIAVKKIHYGPREIPIMRQCIANLSKLNYISQIHDGEWLFKALLAPKPIRSTSPPLISLCGVSASFIFR